MNNFKEDLLCCYLKQNCYGRRGQKKSCDIARDLGIGKSDLQKRVNRLRRQGAPIASSRSGYFYAATAGELYATIHFLRKLVRGLEAAIAGLEATLERFGERGEADR